MWSSFLFTVYTYTINFCAMIYLQPGCWASNEPVSSPDSLCVATKLLDRRWTYDWKNGSFCLQSNWRAPEQSWFYDSRSTFVCWFSHWYCSIWHKWSAFCGCEVKTWFFFNHCGNNMVANNLCPFCLQDVATGSSVTNRWLVVLLKLILISFLYLNILMFLHETHIW